MIVLTFSTDCYPQHRSKARRWVLSGIVGVVALVVTETHGAPTTAAPAPPNGGFEESSRRNRERWEKFGPRKRQQIRKLHKLLQSLPPERRRKLQQKLRSLPEDQRGEFIRRSLRRLRTSEPGDRDIQRHGRPHQEKVLKEFLGKLPTDQRERLKALPREERRKELRRLIREKRQELIRRLPEEYQEPVRKLPPRAQVRFLRLRLAIDAAKSTFTHPLEVERLRELPRARVVGALLPRQEDGVDGENGKAPKRPRFLTEDTWERWQRLKPYERPRVLRVVLRRGPWPPREMDPERFRKGFGKERTDRRRPASQGQGQKPAQK